MILLLSTMWISLHHLHGSSLMIAYEWGLPLNGDWLRQRHSAVGLISWEVLQAARVGLFLPVLNEQRNTENTHAAIRRTKMWWKCSDVILPVVLPLQKQAWSQSRLVRSPPPQRPWHQGWSEALRGSVPLKRGPLRRKTEIWEILFWDTISSMIPTYRYVFWYFILRNIKCFLSR